MTVKIQPRDSKIPALERTNMFYSSEAIGVKSVDEFYNILDVLMNNRFINYEIADIQVDASVTKDTKTAMIADATLSPAVAAPGDTIVINVKLQPFRGEPVTKEIFFTVPKEQPLGEVTLEVRGGGVIPLPYLLEKQKYNLTDEIIRRLKTYKDFDEFYKELRNTDTNNQIVVEILEDGVSMVEDGDGSSSKSAKIDGVEDTQIPGAVPKSKTKENIPGIDDNNDKEPYKAKIDTEYVIRGDGQFVLNIMSPADRDKAKAKLAKEHAKKLKEEAKQEGKASETSKVASKSSGTDDSGSDDEATKSDEDLK